MTTQRAMTLFYTLTLALLFGALFSHLAQSKTPPEGGMIEAELDGHKVRFPVLKSDVTANIQGDLATITVVQTFANPTGKPLNATYLFPLNKDAAVYGMKMEVGNEIITAKIKRKDKARKTYQKAKSQGKAAIILTQHRPNMFTQELANLMPGLPVKITLRYTQTVPVVGGAYELVVPLIVGPRYQPRPQSQLVLAKQDSDAGTDITRSDNSHNNVNDAPPVSNGQDNASAPIQSTGLWQLQQLPPTPPIMGLTIPDKIAKDRVSIQVNLTAPLTLSRVTSATHAITVAPAHSAADRTVLPNSGGPAFNGQDTRVQPTFKAGKHTRATITLANGRIIDNRDFVLRYQLDGSRTNAGLLAHKDKRGGFFSLLIEPPKLPLVQDITARELVFILDTSGSMSGKPMAASKTFMRHALQGLKPKDSFRIIRFGDAASEFSASPVRATPDNLRAGLSFVRNLQASGGTEAMTAINKAFSMAQTPGTLRIVIFLSDGYIGNEAQVLAAISKVIGKARIYAFGVGTSVNRYLMAEMARRARGFARFIDPTETSQDAAISLAQRIESPVLTDISIDWGKIGASQVAPEIIPDLFRGGSIRLQGRYAKAGSYLIAINGMVNGRKARLPLQITLPEEATTSTSAAIPLIWARTQIADAMRDYIMPISRRQRARRDTPASIKTARGAHKERVIKLGLDYSLLTQWTSFVAVSTKIVNASPQTTGNSAIPLPMVKGVSKHAYPVKPGARATFKQRAHKPTSIRFTNNFKGGSTPEPGIWGGLGVLALAGLIATRRRRRRICKKKISIEPKVSNPI